MSSRLAAAGLLLVAARFPTFSAPVVDAAKVVPAAVERRVDAALDDYQQRSGHQIAVAVIDTTGGQTVEQYGIGLARAWHPGRKDEDDGVVLLIAVQDRKVRIEVGRGLEGELTDVQSGRIIRTYLLPRLRAGDYGGAVEVGTQEIRRALGDTTVGAPPPTSPPDGGSGGGSGWLPLVFAGLLALSMATAGLGRRRRGGFGLGGPIIWGGGFGGGGFGGGGFGGGGGGGGFGGGGGGGFGGGGASGGW